MADATERPPPPPRHAHEPLPREQWRYAGLPTLDERTLHRRRERLFLVFAGLFLGTLAMLNILGISRFIHLGTLTLGEGTPDEMPLVFALAVGVLPYPLTFLCTDFISELYGRGRANAVVFTGLLINIWVVAVLWLGGVLPGFEDRAADGALLTDEAGRAPVFFEIRSLAFGAVGASMIAYLVAQFVDVQVFHLWKKLTRGKHLWIRNNGSTLISQLVDTTAVILITYFFTEQLGFAGDRAVWLQLSVLIATGYAFKLVVALADTVPFVLGAPALARYLRLPPPTHQPHPPATLTSEAAVG